MPGTVLGAVHEAMASKQHLFYFTDEKMEAELPYVIAVSHTMQAEDLGFKAQEAWLQNPNSEFQGCQDLLCSKNTSSSSCFLICHACQKQH